MLSGVFKLYFFGYFWGRLPGLYSLTRILKLGEKRVLGQAKYFTLAVEVSEGNPSSTRNTAWVRFDGVGTFSRSRKCSVY